MTDLRKAILGAFAKLSFSKYRERYGDRRDGFPARWSVTSRMVDINKRLGDVRH